MQKEELLKKAMSIEHAEELLEYLKQHPELDDVEEIGPYFNELAKKDSWVPADDPLREAW